MLLHQPYLRKDVQKGIYSPLWRLCYRDAGNLVPLVICMPAALLLDVVHVCVCSQAPTIKDDDASILEQLPCHGCICEDVLRKV